MKKSKSSDTRLWICDGLNRVYCNFKTTMTLSQFNAMYSSHEKVQTFIQTMLPNLPHKGEWIVRLLHLPESYKNTIIQLGSPIYDDKIIYIGIAVTRM